MALTQQTVRSIIGEEVPEKYFKAGTWTGDGSIGNPYTLSVDMMLEQLSTLPGFEPDGSVYLASDFTWKQVQGGSTGGDTLLTNLNFITQVGLTLSGTTWTGTQGEPGNYLNYGLASKKLAAGNNGYIQTRFVNADACDAILTFNDQNVNQRYQLNTYEAGFFISSTDGPYNILRFDNNSIATIGVVAIMNNYYRVERTGSTLKLRTSADGVTFTDIYTYTYTSAADLFINANIDVNRKMYSPKGYNLSD